LTLRVIAWYNKIRETSLALGSTESTPMIGGKRRGSPAQATLSDRVERRRVPREAVPIQRRTVQRRTTGVPSAGDASPISREKGDDL